MGSALPGAVNSLGATSCWLCGVGLLHLGGHSLWEKGWSVPTPVHLLSLPALPPVPPCSPCCSGLFRLQFYLNWEVTASVLK